MPLHVGSEPELRGELADILISLRLSTDSRQNRASRKLLSPVATDLVIKLPNGMDVRSTKAAALRGKCGAKTGLTTRYRRD